MRFENQKFFKDFFTFFFSYKEKRKFFFDFEQKLRINFRHKFFNEKITRRQDEVN